MKLHYFKSDPTNFGDELNAWMWPKLLPEAFLDEDGETLFLGIGSILSNALPPARRYIIAGSGYGGYRPPPTMDEGQWETLFLRGPQTAAALGLPADLAITDGAILVHGLRDQIPAPATPGGIGVMPHYASLYRADWEAICARAGLIFVDPRHTPEEILSQISGLDLLLSEAMHGVILADILRTPWRALRPLLVDHRGKWEDWAASLGVDIDWADPRPGSVHEAITHYGKRRLLGRQSVRLLQSPPARWLSVPFERTAATRLSKIAGEGGGQLSDPERLETAAAKAQAALDAFITRETASA
ncbi:polysaccharide pyruvyl transferase family protein [Paracoccaceae bacterium GXU_MW_L88]